MDRILSPAQVHSVFLLRLNGDSLRSIAEQMAISRQYAMKILSREAYADVKIPEGLIHVAANHVPLKKAQAERRDKEARRLFSQGYTQIEISKKLECGTATICRALKGYKK